MTIDEGITVASRTLSSPCGRMNDISTTMYISGVRANVDHTGYFEAPSLETHVSRCHSSDPRMEAAASFLLKLPASQKTTEEDHESRESQ